MRLATLAVLGGLAVLALGSCGSSGGSTPPRPDAQPRETRLVAFDGGGPLVGLADNRPETFDDLRFQATGIDRVRVVIPWDDVIRPGPRRTVQDQYLRRARAHRKEVLVSFYRSYRNPRSLPSTLAFRAAVRRFRARYPWVRHFSTWSEPNSSAQPTARAPARVAAFYRVLRDECSRRRCVATTGDFRLDPGRESTRWLRRFQDAAGPGPHLWGLSAFGDAGRGSTRLTRAFLARTRGPVWVTETGAVLTDRRHPSPDPARQRRQMAFLTERYPRASRRIERMYVYHWRSAGPRQPFDSALVDVQGSPRPAYWEFTRGIGRLGLP